MATPRTRLPRVSAGCFQKIPWFARFTPISSGFNTPLPVYVATRKNHETQNIVCIFFISKTKAFCLNTFSDEKHIHPACFVGIRYDTE